MIKFIVKRNIYTNKIEDCWQSLKECASDMNVKPPTIKQAIKTGGKCQNYFFTIETIDKKYILSLLYDR